MKSGRGLESDCRKSASMMGYQECSWPLSGEHAKGGQVPLATRGPATGLKRSRRAGACGDLHRKNMPCY